MCILPPIISSLTTSLTSDHVPLVIRISSDDTVSRRPLNDADFLVTLSFTSHGTRRGHLLLRWISDQLKNVRLAAEIHALVRRPNAHTTQQSAHKTRMSVKGLLNSNDTRVARPTLKKSRIEVKNLINSPFSDADDKDTDINERIRGKISNFYTSELRRSHSTFRTRPPTSYRRSYGVLLSKPHRIRCRPYTEFNPKPIAFRIRMLDRVLLNLCIVMELLTLQAQNHAYH